MTTFARAKTNTYVECIHNRELESATGATLFIRITEAEDKFDLSKVAGEVMLYSPKFREDLGCAWVGYEDDFVFFDL